MNISKKSVFLKKKADINTQIVQLYVEQSKLMDKASPSISDQNRIKEIRSEIKKLNTQLLELCKSNQ